jgi:hypothetical protein
MKCEELTDEQYEELDAQVEEVVKAATEKILEGLLAIEKLVPGSFNRDHFANYCTKAIQGTFYRSCDSALYDMDVEAMTNRSFLHLIADELADDGNLDDAYSPLDILDMGGIHCGWMSHAYFSCIQKNLEEAEKVDEEPELAPVIPIDGDGRKWN